MGLQAQFPLGIALAGLNGEPGIEFGQRAIHRLHDRGRNRQPQPQAAVLARGRGVALAEALEHMGHEFRRDAGAAVVLATANNAAAMAATVAVTITVLTGSAATPTPMDTMDSPSAMSTISAYRSAKWAGAGRRQPEAPAT